MSKERNLEVDGLVAFIQEHGDMPFSSAVDWVCRRHGVEPEGEWDLQVMPNAVLDAGLSQEAVRLAICIAGDDRLYLQPLNEIEVVFVHGYDGARMLTLPIIKRLPANREKGFAQPHWAPTVVRLKNDEEEKNDQEGC